MSGLQISLDQLSAESVSSGEATDKVVTLSSTMLRADGCAAELRPYDDPPPWCYLSRHVFRPSGASRS